MFCLLFFQGVTSPTTALALESHDKVNVEDGGIDMTGVSSSEQPDGYWLRETTAAGTSIRSGAGLQDNAAGINKLKHGHIL